MVIKLSLHVGPHDLYPAMDVNFAFWREVKMTAACNFISLGEKIGDLLDKNGKRKKKKEKKRKEENYWSLDWTKKARNLRVVSHSVSWRSWMKADKAGSKFQLLDALWMKEHNFRKTSIVITSELRYRLDTFQKSFWSLFLAAEKLRDLAITAAGTKTSKFVNNSDQFSSYFDVWKWIFGADGRY